MRARRYIFPLLLVVVALLAARGQSHLYYVVAREIPDRPILTLSSSDEQGDPAYSTYREGYRLILDERWTEARKKFTELITRFPGSAYFDDAQYWGTYALKHIDKKRAIADYERLISDFPHNRYFDDAVADLAQLKTVIPPAVPEPPEGLDHPNIFLFREYSQSNLRKIRQQIKRQWRRYQLLRPGGKINSSVIQGDSLMTPPVHMYTYTQSDESLSPEIRVKLEALSTLTGKMEDEQTFQMLREIARDHGQPHPLRELAMESLVTLQKHDPLPVLAEIAEDDTSGEIQLSAIERIGQAGMDKNKSVEILIDIFTALPKDRTEQLETSLFSIADIGNSKAIDFLIRVARTNDNYDLRTNAIYCLGNIGGEKARRALYEILKPR